MRRVLPALVAIVLLGSGTAVAAQLTPAANEESQFVGLINASRAGAGLAPLSQDSELVAYARSHTEAMAAAGKIFHSSTTQLQGVSSGWSLLGENVGLGPDPQVLHEAFMSSSSHRENILGGFNFVGVGAAFDTNGVLFVTVIFMNQEQAAPVTTLPPPTTAPTVLAAATAPSTTTTFPRTTTITSTVSAEAPRHRLATHRCARGAIGTRAHGRPCPPSRYRVLGVNAQGTFPDRLLRTSPNGLVPGSAPWASTHRQ